MSRPACSKTVTPNDKYGVIIDKLTQRLYVFIDGKLWSSCSVSTGLPNDEQPYNETAAGEYLIVSWGRRFRQRGHDLRHGAALQTAAT